MDDRPEQLRRDIEQTRQELRRDTDALNEKVNPTRVVGRRVERARQTMTRMKERVMGSADTGTTAVQDGRQGRRHGRVGRRGDRRHRPVGTR